MSDNPTIKRTYGGSEVTITFKGNNPTIKEDVLNLLCSGFEEKVIKGSDSIQEPLPHRRVIEHKPDAVKQVIPVMPVSPKPAAPKRKKAR